MYLNLCRQLVCAAVSYTGVDQTTSYSGSPQVSNTFNHGTVGSGSTSISVPVTTSSDNAWLVGNGTWDLGSIAAGSNTTLREANGDNTGGATGFDTNAAQTPAGSYSLQVTGPTLSSGTFGGLIVAAVAPATTPNTTNRLAKFITSTTLGDSLFSDDGFNVTLTSGNLFLQIGALIDTITSGILNVGTTNASGVTIGRLGITTTVPGTVSWGRAATTVNCNSNASPAICGAASAGSVAMATGGSTLVVNTSAVTANSQILITEDSSLGARLGMTCNTNTNRNYSISARVPGTSFTIKSSINPNTNKACLSYWIIN